MQHMKQGGKVEHWSLKERWSLSSGGFVD